MDVKPKNLASNGCAVTPEDSASVLTPHAVSKLLSSSIKHVGRLRDNGDIIAVDIATTGSTKPCYRYLKSSVIAFLNRRGLTPEPEPIVSTPSKASKQFL